MVEKATVLKTQLYILSLMTLFTRKKLNIYIIKFFHSQNRKTTGHG